MPKAHEEAGYRFYFYSNENAEPPHMHVRKAENEAKFWLRPVDLEYNYGFNSNELGQIEVIIRKRHRALMKVWNEHQDQRS
jgi:hypothetical protein